MTVIWRLYWGIDYAKMDIVEWGSITKDPITEIIATWRAVFLEDYTDYVFGLRTMLKETFFNGNQQ